jgi:hypothetical protein
LTQLISFHFRLGDSWFIGGNTRHIQNPTPHLQHINHGYL